jgi:hypothetical protein
MILGVKLDRRLVAAIGLNGEEFVFQDSRFVPSRKDALAGSMARYLGRLCEQTKPDAVFFYLPNDAGRVAKQLVALLESAAVAAGTWAQPLSRSDVFGSFGLVPVPSRQHLFHLIAKIWPPLLEGKTHRQLALAEAVAVTLVGDFRHSWPPT